MSARAADQMAKPGRWACRFMGSEDRSAVKPECISPLMARHRARACLSVGSICASGLSSLRYSAIASVSHMVMPSWIRVGTRMDDERSRSSARADGSSAATNSSRKGRPDSRVINHPLRHQEE